MGLAYVWLDVLIAAAPVVTSFALAGVVLCLALSAVALMPMLLSLLILFCPRLLIAIAKFAVVAAAHILLVLLVILLKLPSCSAGTAVDEELFEEELLRSLKPRCRCCRRSSVFSR